MFIAIFNLKLSLPTFPIKPRNQTEPPLSSQPPLGTITLFLSATFKEDFMIHPICSLSHTASALIPVFTSYFVIYSNISAEVIFLQKTFPSSVLV